MSGDPKALPWQFRKGRTRLIVKDANGDGPLFIIEGGYNADAVAMIEGAVRSRHDTALMEAAKAALEHLQELREAWQRGVIDERDGRGGTRSNRNVEVEVSLRTALEVLGVSPKRRLAE